MVVIPWKLCPTTHHWGAWGERRYSPYSFLNLAVDGVSGQHHTLAMLYSQGKNPQYPLDRRLSELVWMQRLKYDI
jgi:hypothetical protein